MLEARGHTAILTRDSDVNLGLAARARVAKTHRANAFVSIHFNAYDGRTQRTETFVHSRSRNSSKRLAELVQQFMVAVTGYRDRELQSANFGVLSPDVHDALTAACLVEVSFMDVAEEEQRLRQATYLEGIALGLAEALHAYSSSAFKSVSATEEPIAEPEDGYELLVR